MKLVVAEHESSALRAWLDGHDVGLAGSELVVVELLRSCRRIDPGAVAAARVVLARIELVPLNRALLEDAAELEPPLLRSLDAIQLASALSIREDVSAFVVYDQRLADAAAATGLEVVAPGA